MNFPDCLSACACAPGAAPGRRGADHWTGSQSAVATAAQRTWPDLGRPAAGQGQCLAEPGRGRSASGVARQVFCCNGFFCYFIVTSSCSVKIYCKILHYSSCFSAYSACDRKCNRASSLAISVSQHCERAFRTPFICLCAPYMKRHSLRRSIEPEEGHKTTEASKNIFSILYLMFRSKCSLKTSPRKKRPPGPIFL